MDAATEVTVDRKRCGAVMIVLSIGLLAGCDRAAAPATTAPRVTIEWWDATSEGGTPLFLHAVARRGGGTTECKVFFEQGRAAHLSPNGALAAIVEASLCDSPIYVLDASGEEIHLRRSITTYHQCEILEVTDGGVVRCHVWPAHEVRTTDAAIEVVLTPFDFTATDKRAALVWRRSDGGHAAPRDSRAAP